MKHLVEILSYDKEGFAPVMSFEDWRVAFLNDTIVLKEENITYLERHLQTDEVFVLLQGSADLFVAQEAPLNIYRIKMKLGHVYQIKKNVLHNITMKNEAKVLLVEKEGTGKENSEFISITTQTLKNATLYDGE